MDSIEEQLAKVAIDKYDEAEKRLEEVHRMNMTEESWFRVLSRKEQVFLFNNPQYRGCMTCWVWKNFSSEFGKITDGSFAEYRAFLQRVNNFSCVHPTYVARDHFTLDDINGMLLL